MICKMKSMERILSTNTTKLVAAARRAKQEIAEGQATTLDYDQL